ncbi:hypothetical protein ES708_11912 [subsurface metagenome]
MAAIWEPLPAKAIVYFTVPIKSADLSVGNWFVRHGGMEWAVTPAIASAGHVRLTLGGPMANPGADVVSFSPPPFDVVSIGGLVPAPAFADFPLT